MSHHDEQRKEQPEPTPQTPSQAEGEREPADAARTPSHPTPSQAEGDEVTTDQALREEKA